MATFQPNSSDLQRLIEEVERLNSNLVALNRSMTNVKMRLLIGMAYGLGSVLGATLLVSIVLWLLRPLQRVPMVEELVGPAVQTIESRQSEAAARPMKGAKGAPDAATPPASEQ